MWSAWITSANGGKIIGKGGSRIKEIRQQTGAAIRVSDPQDGMREISVTGSAEYVDKARCDILNTVDDVYDESWQLGGAVPEHTLDARLADANTVGPSAPPHEWWSGLQSALVVPGGLVQALIGPRGKNIQSLARGCRYTLQPSATDQRVTNLYLDGPDEATRQVVRGVREFLIRIHEREGESRRSRLEADDGEAAGVEAAAAASWSADEAEAAYEEEEEEEEEEEDVQDVYAQYRDEEEDVAHVPPTHTHASEAADAVATSGSTVAARLAALGLSSAVPAPHGASGGPSLAAAPRAGAPSVAERAPPVGGGTAAAVPWEQAGLLASAEAREHGVAERMEGAIEARMRAKQLRKAAVETHSAAHAKLTRSKQDLQAAEADRPAALLEAEGRLGTAEASVKACEEALERAVRERSDATALVSQCTRQWNVSNLKPLREAVGEASAEVDVASSARQSAERRLAASESEYEAIKREAAWLEEQVRGVAR